MLAYMSKDSFEKTLQSGLATYYSRSRKALWTKGESSGHYQIIEKIFYDCDEDALLLEVKQIGAACHTGHVSCFYREIDPDLIHHLDQRQIDAWIHRQSGGKREERKEKEAEKVNEREGGRQGVWKD